MNSRYEKVLDQKIGETTTTIVEVVPLGDSHEAAFQRGRRVGLKEALAEYQKQKRTNQDPDDDL